MTLNQRDELAKKVAQTAGTVKLTCGVANNAALYIMLDGYDHARQCKNYKHEIKRAFKSAIEEFHNYERNLIYAKTNRMFHVADLDDKARRLYGDNVTDRQYYEFWAAIGANIYQETKPFITSLWNKHRLSLLSHNVNDADHIAWVLTAHAAIRLAVNLYNKAIRDCAKDFDVSINVLENIFHQFSLDKVQAKWQRAMLMLAPDAIYPLNSTERKNIAHGISQLCELWMNSKLMYKSVTESVENYDEIFRTKGYQAKVIDEINEQEGT